MLPAAVKAPIPLTSACCSLQSFLVMLQLLGCWAVQNIDRLLGNTPHSWPAHHVFSWASC